MCLGGNGDSTVTQKAAPKTKEEIEAIKLGLESMRLRNKFLPALMEQFGYGQDMSGNLMKLPPTQEQQQKDQLMTTSLQGAQDAAGEIRSRLGMAAGMLPGLLRSVQASMAPGTRSAGAIGNWNATLPQFQAPPAPFLTPPPPNTAPVRVGVPIGAPPDWTPPASPVDSSDARTNAVTALYKSLLGREPDQEGLDSWVNSGKSLEEIKAGIMSSPEYFALHNTPPSS